jgi:indole-3-glycerol phosphate synthase
MGILEEICTSRREAIGLLKPRLPYAKLEAGSLWAESRRPFGSALRREPDAPVSFLAEIKRASPSSGAIRAGADPVPIAQAYAGAGAAALSILTEPEYFDGDPAFLGAVRGAVDRPLLMKDFLVDEWQVAWARSLGADAVLLIVAALDRVLLRDLWLAARDVGLESLVEVHDAAELDRALELGAAIVGINHRNLKTFEVDTTLSRRLLPRIPAGVVRVGESGIRTRADVVELEKAGLDALLVGESLMRAADPGAALRRLRGEGEP